MRARDENAVRVRDGERREGWGGLEEIFREEWVQDFFHILLAICCESQQSFVTDSIIRGWYYIWSHCFRSMHRQGKSSDVLLLLIVTHNIVNV